VARWDVVAGSRQRRPLDAQADAGILVDTIAAAAAAARELATPGTPWGIAIPGPFDYERGVGDFRGVGKFGALRGVALGALLGRAGAAAARTPHFLNDAEAFALGEWVHGAGRGHGRMIATTVGTGIGSAFLAEGTAVDHGPGVPQQGRLDLLEVNGRPLEETVSRSAILSRYAAAHLAAQAGRPEGPAAEAPRSLDVRDIAELAAAADDVAVDALRGPLLTLGRVLGPCAVDFRAGAVVVGGSIATAWEVVGPALRAGMDQAAPGWDDACVLLRAHHLEDSSLVGAAWSAWHGSEGA
jgi:glucokinase